jgi:hypothetical protein
MVRHPSTSPRKLGNSAGPLMFFSMFLAYLRTVGTTSLPFFSVAGFPGWPFLVCALERVRGGWA